MKIQEPMFSFPVNVNTQVRRGMTQLATPKGLTRVYMAKNQ